MVGHDAPGALDWYKTEHMSNLRLIGFMTGLINDLEREVKRLKELVAAHQAEQDDLDRAAQYDKLMGDEEPF